MSTSGVNFEEKMDVCQTCGDKGIIEQLLFCVKCLVAANHSYCLYKLPGRGEKVIWTCEDCSPRVAEQCPTPRKSERITEVAKRKLGRVKQKKTASFSTVEGQAFVNRLIQSKQSMPDDLFQKEERTTVPSRCLEKKVPRRRLVFVCVSSDEESEPEELIKVDTSHSDIGASPIAYSLGIPQLASLRSTS